MTDRRLELQALLEETLGARRVYYQPPANLKMEYPCIVYTRDSTFRVNANNELYAHKKRYQLTYISRSPDTSVPDLLEQYRYCIYDNSAVVNNLHHTYLSIYF